MEDIMSHFVGTALKDVIHGTTGVDYIWGLDGNDVLYGDAGPDTLDGGTGQDTMCGGTGNDTYIVDSSGDVVIESIDEGTDTVQSTVSYTLTAYVENLVLMGSGAIDGTGNKENNVITGNSND